jgi:L-rhamnose mutarotase
VGKYLLLWKVNFSFWPLEPSKSLELNEKMWAAMDDLMKKGLVKDYGIFVDGQSGYLIAEGEADNLYMAANMFIPYVSVEVHEIVSYEKQKEILRGMLTAAAAQK